MFPDDVTVHPASAEGLQNALHLCPKWPGDPPGTWSVRKCHILLPNDSEKVDDTSAFQIALRQLHVVDSAHFLGVTITGDRIAPEKTLTLLNTAIQRVGLL